MLNKGQLVASADGTPIWAQAAGNPNNPAVVFIHGFSCTGLSFSKQFSDPDLLQNLYLLRYDVRGHGRSGQPLEAKDYESLRHAEDFKAVMDAFGVKRPFVAGWYVLFRCRCHTQLTQNRSLGGNLLSLVTSSITNMKQRDCGDRCHCGIWSCNSVG